MQETLDELRKHADHLRQQYHRLLSQWEEKTEREKAESAKEPTSLMKRYLELSRQRDRLWLENQALQDAFEEREKVSFRFQRLFDVNYQLVRPLARGTGGTSRPPLTMNAAPACRWTTRSRRLRSTRCRCRRP